MPTRLTLPAWPSWRKQQKHVGTEHLPTLQVWCDFLKRARQTRQYTPTAPAQQVALGAALALAGVPRVLFAAIGTDGRDGPTDVAGAWVDGETVARGRAHGQEAAAALAANDSYHFFAAAGGHLRTGPTLTNVNDLYLLFAW
ncbi:MAG: hypothetical protein K6U89_08535 [Chloroflexi bacterium]|nr:hypothetical protein [Chloroflexota bacterium]